MPGALICANASSVAPKTAFWPAQSPGMLTLIPLGRSIAAMRGTPADAVKSGIVDRVIVLKPDASSLRCTSPTDQLHTGQTGTSTTASTCSCRSLSTMAGTLSSSKRCGRIV